jgi:hypothetical protein
MESWELIMYFLIVGLYVDQKIARKARIQTRMPVFHVRHLISYFASLYRFKAVVVI